MAVTASWLFLVHSALDNDQVYRASSCEFVLYICQLLCTWVVTCQGLPVFPFIIIQTIQTITVPKATPGAQSGQTEVNGERTCHCTSLSVLFWPFWPPEEIPEAASQARKVAVERPKAFFHYAAMHAPLPHALWIPQWDAKCIFCPFYGSFWNPQLPIAGL